MTKEEGYFETYDGLRLFYRVWLSEKLDHPVFIIHGLHEHSGRYGRIIDKLNLPGFSYFSFDQRGHGFSEGKKGYALGVDEYVKDINAFWNFVMTRWSTVPPMRVIWYGHSFGGLWITRYAFQYPGHLRAVVFSSPCFGIRTWIHSLDRLIAAFAPVFPEATVHSFVFRRLLSHDPEERTLHREDTLIHNRIGIVLLRDALRVMPETIQRASEFKHPLLILASGKEYVVQFKKTKLFFERAGSAEKEIHIFPGMFHELVREKEWEEPIGLMRAFLLRYSGG